MKELNQKEKERNGLFQHKLLPGLYLNLKILMKILIEIIVPMHHLVEQPVVYSFRLI